MVLTKKKTQYIIKIDTIKYKINMVTRPVLINAIGVPAIQVPKIIDKDEYIIK